LNGTPRRNNKPEEAWHFVFLRIVIEGKTLFGIEEHSEFAKKRKRLFPAIW
jgi:hypothetical protein